MSVDRIETYASGELNEIVSSRGAHLERLGTNSWFLIFYHEDGTETAIWFKSKDLRRPLLEKRLPSDRKDADAT